MRVRAPLARVPGFIRHSRSGPRRQTGTPGVRLRHGPHSDAAAGTRGRRNADDPRVPDVGPVFRPGYPCGAEDPPDTSYNEEMAAAAFDDRGLVIACPSCGQKNRLAYERLGVPARCGQCKQDVQLPASPLEMSSTADFDRLVASASIPVVVDFWAPWCGPCRMVAPEFAKVAARAAGRFLVVKVNTDVLNDLGQRLNIRSIPTLAVFSGGREAARTAGARPAADIEAFVQQAEQMLR